MDRSLVSVVRKSIRLHDKLRAMAISDEGRANNQKLIVAAFREIYPGTVILDQKQKSLKLLLKLLSNDRAWPRGKSKGQEVSEFEVLLMVGTLLSPSAQPGDYGIISTVISWFRGLFGDGPGKGGGSGGGASGGSDDFRECENALRELDQKMAEFDFAYELLQECLTANPSGQPAPPSNPQMGVDQQSESPTTTSGDPCADHFRQVERLSQELDDSMRQVNSKCPNQ